MKNFCRAGARVLRMTSQPLAHIVTLAVASQADQREVWRKLRHGGALALRRGQTKGL